MSQTIGQPGPPPGMMPPGGPGMGQAPQGMPPAGIPPGMAGPPTGLPQPQPNPAFAQWMQGYQAQQQVVQQNAKLTAQFKAACNLIRTDGTRGFKLDIEADSTIAPDEQAEKQARIEFLQQIVPLIEQGAPIAQGNPKMAKLFGEIAMFAIRGFRVARTLEDAFEQAFEILGQMPPPPPKGGHGTPPPDPAIEHAKIAAQVGDMQMKTQTAQQDTKAKTETAQMVAATKAQTDQMAIAQKQQAAQMQFAASQQRDAVQQQNDQAELAIAVEKMKSQERMASARALKMGAAGASSLT